MKLRSDMTDAEKIQYGGVETGRVYDPMTRRWTDVARCDSCPIWLALACFAFTTFIIVMACWK